MAMSGAKAPVPNGDDGIGALPHPESLKENTLRQLTPIDPNYIENILLIIIYNDDIQFFFSL